MPWVKMTDRLHDNDKLGGVSDAAFRLWILAISWSSLKLTDGHIPASRPIRLTSLRNPEKTIGELLAAKLWHRAASPCASCVKQREAVKADPIPSGGYVIHHYFGDPTTRPPETYQFPRWVIEARRAELREKGRRGGQASGQSRSATLEPDGSGIDIADEAPGSSATLQGVEEESKRHAQAPRSSATLHRTVKVLRAPMLAKAPLLLVQMAMKVKMRATKRHAQARTPVLPVPRPLDR